MIVYRMHGTVIEPFECEKMSTKFVCVNGRRIGRFGVYESYHETPEAAKKWAIKEATTKSEDAERSLAYWHKQLDAAMEIRIPEPTK